MKMAALSMVLVLMFGACGSDEGQVETVRTDEVDMAAGQVFDPSGAQVQVGDTVTFVNTSKEAHTVTAYGSELPAGAPYFASGGATSESEAREDLTGGLIREGESYSFTFTETGTYRYFCIPHEGAGMKGTIVVEE
jgi:plastocyanin